MDALMAIASIAYTAAAGGLALALSTTWLALRNRTRGTMARERRAADLTAKDGMLRELDSATTAFDEAFIAVEGDVVRLVDVAAGAGATGPQQLGVDQPVAVVPTGSAEHRAHVLGGECRVLEDQALEVRCEAGDLVDHALTHLGLEPRILRRVLLDREPQRERRRGRLARWAEVRVGRRRDLECHRRIGRDEAAPAVLELALQILRRGEQADRALHLRIVEELIRCGELRHAVEREVHLHV